MIAEGEPEHNAVREGGERCDASEIILATLDANKNTVGAMQMSLQRAERVAASRSIARMSEPVVPAINDQPLFPPAYPPPNYSIVLVYPVVRISRSRFCFRFFLCRSLSGAVVAPNSPTIPDCQSKESRISGVKSMKMCV